MLCIKKLLTITLTAAFLLVSGMTVAQADLSDGLVAYYPFNGNANDESGNGNNGTVNGATLTADRFGNEKSAYYLSQNYIEIPDSVKGLTYLSMSLWVKEDSMSYEHGEAYVWFGSHNENYVGISHFSTSLEFNVSNANENITISLDFPDSFLSEFQHYILIYDGNNGVLKAYHNGILLDKKESSSGEIQTTGEVGAFGKHWWWNLTSTSNRLNGVIDDIRIYNRALSASEIQELYQGGASAGAVKLEVQTDSTDKRVGVPFDITVTAIKSNGSQDTSVNGVVSLSSTAGYGTVSPTSIKMVNGKWQGEVKINEESCAITLSASSRSLSGVSGSFNVSGAGGLGSLGGVIKDNYANKVTTDVQIQLSGCQSYNQTFSGGAYQFKDIISGTYKLTATHIASGATFTADNLFIRGGSCMTSGIEFVFLSPTSGKTPVLLIAGVMGSTRKSDWKPSPRLPAQQLPDGSKLKLAAPDIVGWTSLKEQLEQAGYVPGVTLFEVPYDWRMDVNQIYDKYLIKAIKLAKEKAVQNKVNIIAHSMGGLVTRAYIQSDQYQNDIDRFAMVGTPNLGSGTAYYLWEGGDPKLADDIRTWGVGLAGNFYYTVVSDNYKIVHNKSVAYNEYEKIFNYFHGIGDSNPNAMTSVEQLLPTYFFLDSSNGLKPLSKNPNTFLVNLNKDSEGMSRMGLQNNTDNKVKTIVFAGKSQSTIERVTVGQSGNPLYVDGNPDPAHDEDSAYMTTDGDSTVRLVSALWPASQQWASQAAIKDGEHGKLINTYASELVKFVEGEVISDKSVAGERAATRAETIEVKSLAISIIGRPQMYLVDSINNGTGINNLTQQRESDIPESDVIFDEEGGSISVDNLLDGVYTLYITGAYAEDYMLDLSFTDQEKTVFYSYQGFNNRHLSKIIPLFINS